MIHKDYEKIYKLLDSVNPVPFDCGKICGAACCKSSDEETGIFLLSGEETMRDLSEWKSVETVDGFSFVTCKGPNHCNRKTRPIQCRTFPLLPTISPDKKLILSINTMDLPYSCPLIESDASLDPDFIKVTTHVWKRLLQDPKNIELIKKWNAVIESS